MNAPPPSRTFQEAWTFAERHMPAVRVALGSLPARLFFDIETASPKKDLEGATDLVLSLASGDIAVRVRRRHYYDTQVKDHLPHDWSVRAMCHGHRTEIDKLRDGFGRWYFMAYSADDNGRLIAWWLIDLDAVRSRGVLDEDWKVNDNHDGTAGKYIPIGRLAELGCIVASHFSQPESRIGEGVLGRVPS